MQTSLDVEKIIIVGDDLTKDIKSANMAGVPCIWMGVNPYDMQANIEAINSGSVRYDSAVLGISQVPDAINALITPRPYTVGILMPT